MLTPRINLLLFAVCIASASAQADQLRPHGQNCDLAAPPAGSGEEAAHSTTLKIFPRLRDMTTGYDGCQVTWYNDGPQWQVVGITYFRRGTPAAFWSPVLVGEKELFCKYQGGIRISGPPDRCPAFKSLRKRSVAEGCIDRARAEGKLPDDCRYE